MHSIPIHFNAWLVGINKSIKINMSNSSPTTIVPIHVFKIPIRLLTD